MTLLPSRYRGSSQSLGTGVPPPPLMHRVGGPKILSLTHWLWLGSHWVPVQRPGQCLPEHPCYFPGVSRRAWIRETYVQLLRCPDTHSTGISGPQVAPALLRALCRGFPGGSDSKASAYNVGDQLQFLGREGPLEKEMAIHSSTLAWKIPWTEEPDRLQSMGSQSWTRLHFHCVGKPVSVSCCSVAKSCQTLCDPMDSSTPDLPVPHYLPEFAQVHFHLIGDAIQPSHPLSSPSPPAFNLSQHQGLFQ